MVRCSSSRPTRQLLAAAPLHRPALLGTLVLWVLYSSLPVPRTGFCLPIRCFGRLGQATYMPRGAPYFVVILLAIFGFFLLWVGADPCDHCQAEEPILASPEKAFQEKGSVALPRRARYSLRHLRPQRSPREHGAQRQQARWQRKEARQFGRPEEFCRIWPAPGRAHRAAGNHSQGYQRFMEGASGRSWRRICRATGAAEGERSTYPLEAYFRGHACKGGVDGGAQRLAPSIVATPARVSEPGACLRCQAGRGFDIRLPGNASYSRSAELVVNIRPGEPGFGSPRSNMAGASGDGNPETRSGPPRSWSCSCPYGWDAGSVSTICDGFLYGRSSAFCHSRLGDYNPGEQHTSVNGRCWGRGSALSVSATPAERDVCHRGCRYSPRFCNNYASQEMEASAQGTRRTPIQKPAARCMLGWRWPMEIQYHRAHTGRHPQTPDDHSRRGQRRRADPSLHVGHALAWSFLVYGLVICNSLYSRARRLAHRRTCRQRRTGCDVTSPTHRGHGRDHYAGGACPVDTTAAVGRIRRRSGHIPDARKDARVTCATETMLRGPASTAPGATGCDSDFLERDFGSFQLRPLYSARVVISGLVARARGAFRRICAGPGFTRATYASCPTAASSHASAGDTAHRESCCLCCTGRGVGRLSGRAALPACVIGCLASCVHAFMRGILLPWGCFLGVSVVVVFVGACCLRIVPCHIWFAEGFRSCATAEN